MDRALFPALLLASEYHQRWEIENTIDELKTHLNGRKTPIRSLKPREVVQEIYGLLLGHYAVRHLMFTAAQQAGISPLRLGFTGTLKVLRLAISDFQDVQSEELPFFSPSWLQTSWLKKFRQDRQEAILELSKSPAPNFLLKSQCIAKQD